MKKLINNILPHYKEDKYYFFYGNYYSRYTHGSGTDKNYPLPMTSEWHNLWSVFPGPYDASLIKYNCEKYYFFKGDKYVRYTPGQGVDSGYPKKISAHWGGLTDKMPGPYDACFYASLNDKYYFFKGDSYVRLSTGEGGGVDPGYPKKIADHWNGMPAVFPPPYDAVVQSKSNDSIYYFFKGTEYVRYKRDTGIDKSVGEYPQSTEYQWPGIWQLKSWSAITLGAFTPQGPTFSIRLLEDKTVSMIAQGSLNLQCLQTIKNNGFKGCTKIYRVNNMTPGSETIIGLQLDSKTIANLPIKNAPANTTEESFTLAMGSCLDDARHLQLQIGTVKHMVNDKPDMMIWNGDTSYYIGRNGDDWTTTKEYVVDCGDMTNPPHDMFLRMFKTRHHPSVANAMCTIPALSTWDDHDFGFNNAQPHEPNKMNAAQIKNATEVFRTCWPNNYELAQLDQTIQHKVRYGKTEIFFPDCRRFRNSNDKKILGTSLSTLITSMKNSDASLKILVLSSQLIPSVDDGDGFFHSASAERTTLLNTFKDPSFNGRVLILSGDVHYSELSYDGNTPGNPKVIEVTSSPMLLKSNKSPSTPDSSSKPTRIWSVKGNTYAILNISYDNNVPVVTISMRNESGNTADIFSTGGGAGSAWGKADAIWQANGELKQLS